LVSQSVFLSTRHEVFIELKAFV